MYGRETLKLTEVWRIGGDSMADEEFFGVITDIDVDDDNLVYLTDVQLAEVRVFDETGSYVTTIGREGEGPGEFRRPTGTTFLPDGRIGVTQPFPSKMVLFTPDGEPAGDLPFEPEGKGFSSLGRSALCGDNIAAVFRFGNPSESGFTQNAVLAFVSPEGKVVKRLREADVTMEYANSLCVERDWNNFANCWSAAPQGMVAVRDSYVDYAFSIYDAEGNRTVVTREYSDLPRTDDERKTIEKRWAAGIARWVPNPTFEIEKNWNPIEDLHARRDGTVWVRTTRGKWDLADGEMARLDVFDADGRYLYEAVLQGDFDPENDGLFFDDDHIFVVTDLVSASMAFGGGDAADEEMEEDPEPMSVICYRVDLQAVAAR
jgi:hypothetical protein